MDMFDELFELGSKVGLWLSSRANRLRLRGTRVEVMAFIVCECPERSILLGQSKYDKMWMPPQEGVRLAESFEEALYRCLEVECGLDLPETAKGVARALHVRSIRHMGVLDLPQDRHGERLVAHDALGTALESIVLKRKGYWMATVLVVAREDIAPRADGKELLDLKWFTFEEARDVILETNRPEKAEFLAKCLNVCEGDLKAGPHKEGEG
jgi:ADP-ribose pyrophosphatase YjhB (NUDIX family)